MARVNRVCGKVVLSPIPLLSFVAVVPVLAVAMAFLTIANVALAQQRYRTPDEAVAALISARGPALRCF
jgi:hypothetical protein